MVPPLGALQTVTDENHKNRSLVFLESLVQGKVAGEELNLKSPSEHPTRDTFVQ